MKKLLIFLLLSVSGFAQKLEIQKLTEDFYVFTTHKDYGGQPYPANGMYIVTPKGAILIDTPWDTTQCQPLLDSIWRKHKKKVILCLATHFHDDRTGGFDIFRKAGIATYSSEQTYALCEKFGEPKANKIVRPDQMFEFGTHRFRVIYPGEGHTPDNIVVWFPADKILYGGCFVKSEESPDLGNLADANVQAWPNSIQNVMSRCPDAKFVIPGHLGWQGNALEHTLKLLQEHNSR
ncbi:BlaB/IND/MUS family subclass B1 metallo-beta-lactamase [Flavobacterium longum]|uniref:BlaB/IND/MUS family subclass B1 metallo-beta-lactamase n=1 Tax=Flavobacterium longum TaxID=1299340 RepID=UPI0039E91C5C